METNAQLHPDVIARIGSDADARWEELEATCRMPDDLYQRIAEAGVFRQLLPTDGGGGGRSPVEVFDLSIDLAWHNGSLGWIASQGAGMAAITYAIASPRLRAELLSDAAFRLAGVNTAVGRYRSVADGVVIDGRWPFASGCEGTTWCAALVLPQASDERADLCMALLRADQYTVDRDWDAVGLRGTGSHAIVAAGALCSPDRLLRLAGRPVLDHPVACASPSVGGAWPVSLAVAATQLGIARRAIDELVEIVATKAPAPTFTPVRQSAAMQRELSRLDGEWFAARAGAREALLELWEAARVDDVGWPQRRKVAICNQTANATAGRIVDDVWRAAGMSGIARTHPLARCLRDSRPLLGHVSANERVLEFAEQVRQRTAPLDFPVI